MLNIFLGRKPIPNYTLVEPPSGREKIFVKEDVSTGSLFCWLFWTNALGRLPKSGRMSPEQSCAT